ncbi:MAG: hypothetical protein AMJ63_05710 [Myxococcales bacterium SG8_38_1]|nr:MAG: hypothetical protein AMJ63_05710 [Myxococcales bacterium SG8_38_1]
MAVYATMELPPAEPVSISGSPLASKTMVGDMDDRGRFRGATAFTAGAAPAVGACEKSVSSLFRKKPLVMRTEPYGKPTDAVIDTALPSRSMIDRCVVPAASIVLSVPRSHAALSSSVTKNGSPCVGVSAGANRSVAR